MTTTSFRSNMPPVMPQPPAGTQTSDRYGHVISTRPLPAPEQPVVNASGAPTCDRWGNVISVPANAPERPAVAIPGTDFVVETSGVVAWE